MTYRNLPDKSHPNAKQMKPIVGVDIYDDPHDRNVSPLPNAFDNNYARHSADGTRVSNGHSIALRKDCFASHLDVFDRKGCGTSASAVPYN